MHCRATGSGRDIQVGNPAVQSGPSVVQVSTLSAVDWNHLGPGDTVRVFWRATPYFEKFTLSTSGTAAQPIRVCGVPGPDGQLPVISGQNATTRPDLNAGSLGSGIQDLAVIDVYNPDYFERPDHLVIEGPHVQDTLGGAGTASDVLSYTATDGSRRRYDPASACIQVQEGQDITLRGNHPTGCGLPQPHHIGRPVTIRVQSHRPVYAAPMSRFHDTDQPQPLAALHQAGEHEVYVLRVWYERNGEAAVWRASVKGPYEAPRRHFARPEALLAYLQGRLNPEPRDTS